MAEFPKAYEVYKHFKGNLYQIITLAEHSETGEVQVVYQGLQAPYKIYVRPLLMFQGKTDKEKYPEIKQKLRFEKVEISKPTQEKNVEKKSLKTESLQVLVLDPEHADYDEEEVLEPLLMDFLDSDTYEEKLNILVALHHRITDDIINTMAMALDVEISEGKIEEKYESLKSCLITLQRYECNRLR